MSTPTTLLPDETIVRGNPTKAVVDAIRVRGVDQAVPDHATRDALDADVRKAHMWVRTANDSTTWELGNDLVTWSAVSFGGGGGSTVQAVGDDGAAARIILKGFDGAPINFTGPLIRTGTFDSSYSTPAGSEIAVIGNKLYWTGSQTYFGSTASLYSVHRTGFEISAPYGLASSSPCSTVLGDYFDSNGVVTAINAGSLNQILSQEYRDSDDSGDVINQTYAGGNWAGARGCSCIIQDPAGWANGGVQMIMFTAPATNTVWIAAQPAISGYAIPAYSESGGAPTAIACSPEGVIWVYFSGTGTGTLKKFIAPNTNTIFNPMAPVKSLAMTGVVDLIFDGIYFWALSTTPTSGTTGGSILRFDVNGNTVDTIGLAYNIRTVTSKSRMAFDGRKIWLTRTGSIDCIDGSGQFLCHAIGIDISTHDLRGIACDQNGTVYIAGSNNSTGEIEIMTRPDLFGKYGSIETAGDIITVTQFNSAGPSRVPIKYPLDQLGPGGISGNTRVFDFEVIATLYGNTDVLSKVWRKHAVFRSGYDGSGVYQIGTPVDLIPPVGDIGTEDWDIVVSTDDTSVPYVMLTVTGSATLAVKWSIRLKVASNPGNKGVSYV